MLSVRDLRRAPLRIPMGSHGPEPAAATRHVRPLGVCERFFRIYALAFPVHFCLVGEIGGAINPAKLRAGLEQVRGRHPALRVGIADDAEAGPSFYATDNPIEVHTAPVGADWRRVVESELNRPFDTIPGPLMRATALWESDGVSLVLTFHHAIADALSGARILGDLMRALAGEPLAALPLIPPLEAMIPNLASPPASASDSDADVAVNGPEQGAQASDRLAASIATLEWDRAETANLVRSCRANGTTVHGAICAAAARHIPASDADTVRMQCPIDLSGVAGIEAGHCGVFIGAGAVEIPATRERPLWLDAREVVDSLRAARSPAAVAGMLQWITAAFPPTAGADKLRQFFASQPPDSAVISNLGVLPLAADYGPLALKAIWGPAMLTNLPADRQTIGVSTFDDRLRMVHQSYKPIHGLLGAIRGTLLVHCA